MSRTYIIRRGVQSVFDSAAYTSPRELHVEKLFAPVLGGALLLAGSRISSADEPTGYKVTIMDSADQDKLEADSTNLKYGMYPDEKSEAQTKSEAPKNSRVRSVTISGRKFIAIEISEDNVDELYITGLKVNGKYTARPDLRVSAKRLDGKKGIVLLNSYILGLVEVSDNITIDKIEYGSRSVDKDKTADSPAKPAETPKPAEPAPSPPAPTETPPAPAPPAETPKPAEPARSSIKFSDEVEAKLKALKERITKYNTDVETTRISLERTSNEKQRELASYASEKIGGLVTRVDTELTSSYQRLDTKAKEVETELGKYNKGFIDGLVDEAAKRFGQFIRGNEGEIRTKFESYLNDLDMRKRIDEIEAQLKRKE